MIIEDRTRRKRLRLLISRLNKERKRQAKQIDILCNDFIAAQRDFIARLNTIAFAVNFYESILGMTDLGNLLQAAVKLIREEITDASVTFFLRQGEDFELHIFENGQGDMIEKRHLENYFTSELMDSICKSNKVCTLEDMLGMGMEGSPAGLSGISTVTIPLGLAASSLGFILIYRCSEGPLRADEVSKITAVTCGLSQAIQACKELLRAVK
jgi:transcriptional regulator with GAF, ATPase, and Fis domain